jgi:carbon-monoxide dehydrogenase medium subunit
MIPAAFDYVRPSDLAGALRILSEREGEAKVLSGGYSLIPLLKLRLAQPGLLVDLRDVGGLDAIVETDDELRIGARATHRQIHEDPTIQNYPLLHDVAGGIGDPQVRNWGTIGGSVAHADPASDWPAALLAANAKVVCVGSSGERVISARDFFLDTFTTAIEPTEVLTEIRFGRRPKGLGGAYTKLERKAGDFATAGVAAIVRLTTGGGEIEWAGLGVTGVSGSPFAASEAEAVVKGQRPSEDLFRAAGAAAAAASEPAADVRGSVDYKRAMVAELTLRSLRQALVRALAHS